MNFKTEETKINSPINSDIIPNKINESINEQLYESMSSITGIDGESFHSFIPSAYLHEEDRKTIEKIRDAGYKIPKYNILEEYKQHQIF